MRLCFVQLSSAWHEWGSLQKLDVNKATHVAHAEIWTNLWKLWCAARFESCDEGGPLVWSCISNYSGNTLPVCLCIYESIFESILQLHVQTVALKWHFLSGYTDSVFLAWLQRLLHLTEINIQQIFSASSMDARTTKLKANLVPFLQDGSFSPLVTHLQSKAELSGQATSESKRVFSPETNSHAI